MTRSRAWYRTAAGLALFATAFVGVLGIVTAETLFPGYDTGGQTISRLGATGGEYEVYGAAAATFNGAMIAAGLLVLGAAYGVYRGFDHRTTAALVAVSGAGVLGVGLFPIQRGVLHAIPSLLAFGGGGLAAIAAGATIVDGPFRYVSVALGVVALVALALFVGLGEAAPLGVGGIERWVAYPILLWTAGVGGYLLGASDPPATAAETDG